MKYEDTNGDGLNLCHFFIYFGKEKNGTNVHRGVSAWTF